MNANGAVPYLIAATVSLTYAFLPNLKTICKKLICVQKTIIANLTISQKKSGSVNMGGQKMAKVNGQLVTCDRCGKQIFRKCTGEGEADGGFTRWNNFEAMPDGWDLVAVPSSLGWIGNGNAYNGYIQACPDCSKLWEEIILDEFLKGTKYERGADDVN